MKVIIKHLLSIIVIFAVVNIFVIFNSNEKKNYDTLIITYIIPCHQIDFFYELINKETKELQNKFSEEVLISRLNYPACKNNYSTNSTSFIGDKKFLNNLFNKLNEKNLEKLINEKNLQELENSKEFLQLINETKIPKQFINLNKENLIEDIITREFYIGRKNYTLLEKEIAPRVKKFNLKLTIQLSSWIYILGTFLLFMIRNKNLGFYLK